MPRRILVLIGTLMILLCAPQARACTSNSDYVAPSNFELVQMADAIGIYVAEAPPPTGGARASPANADELALHPFGAPLVFRLDRTLLGRPPETMGGGGLAGMIEPYRHDPDEADPALPNPDYGGGCTRMTFERGARYLLILQRDTGGWYLALDGGNRAMEDYEGEASLWARTIRRYIALRPLSEAARTATLTAMRDSGRDRDGTPLLPVERNDIAHHLRAPSQWKPTAWLLDRYGRAVRGEAVDIVLEGPIQFTQLQGDRAHTLLTSLANGRHPGARPLFERLLEAPGSDGRDLALALRYFSGNGQYQRAWRWIETRLANHLLTLDTRDARILLGAVAAVQRGEDYEPGHERWRSDPHVAATWPELALALYWYQVRSFGADDANSFGNTFDAIPVTDYRARPLLTIALGMGYDGPVTDWAIAELARPAAPAPAPSDDADRPGWPRRDEPDLLPLRALVSAWSAERSDALARVFCQGGPRRRLVMFAIGQWGDDLYGGLLDGMAGVPDLNAEERSTVLRAAIEFTARNIRENGSTNLLPGDENNWLVTRLARGQPEVGPDRRFCDP